MEEINKLIQEFERTRMQLGAVESQNQSLGLQSKMMEEALRELGDTKEKKVYKAVGNILILTEVDKVNKELKDQKETVDLRLKTLKNQEKTTIDKLNSLKSQIEAAQKKGQGAEENKEAK